MNFEANATALLEHYHAHKNENYIEDACPPEFTFKGSGSFRACYAKDGWVYKVIRYWGDRDRYNIREYEEYLRLVDLVLPDHVALPATELLKVSCSCDNCGGTDQYVIVMEEVKGEFISFRRLTSDPEYRALLESMQKAMVLEDITGTNVIINDDGWWPIDLHI